MAFHRLKDQWVLITGATSGIGKACAFHFAEAGSNPILTGRRKNRLKEISKEIAEHYSVQVETFAIDVLDKEVFKECVACISEPVDNIVSNAGLASGKDPVDQ